MTPQPDEPRTLDDDMPDAEPDPAGVDEDLAAAAQGFEGNSDTSGDRGAIDAAGAAAGLPLADGVPLGGPGTGLASVERRDQHRWELDPDSAEDAPLP